MSNSSAPTPPPPTLAIPAGRDLTLDAARVACVLLVVVVHLLQVGIGSGPDGAIEVSRPLESIAWFGHATWVGQIMPLFFVVGGFATLTGYRSLIRRGGTDRDFVRGRVLRLAQPAVTLFVFFAVALSVATALSIAPEIVSAAAVGAGSPLWFLAAYVLCQAAAPTMIRAHGQAPRATLAALLIAVILVDAARYASGIDEIGLLNLAFVWLLVQQFGFCYHDGWFDRRSPGTLLAIAVIAYALLIPMTSWGPWHVDMLANLNPPTLPLVVIAVAQACLLRLLRRPLTALMRTRGAQAIVWVAGTRLMTIYLWHLPVILILSGATLLIPGAAPVPGSAAWWWSRPLMLVAVLAAVYLLSLAIARWESPRITGPAPAALPLWVGTVAAFVAPFAVMFAVMHGAFPWYIAVGGAALLIVSVWLLGRGSRRGAAAPVTNSA